MTNKQLAEAAINLKNMFDNSSTETLAGMLYALDKETRSMEDYTRFFEVAPVTPRRETKPLALRLTHRYVDSYKDGDDWETIGSVTPIEKFIVKNEYDSTLVNQTVAVDVLEGISRIATKAALTDFFTVGGCDCEHDCCGCISRMVISVKQLEPRIFRVAYVETYNY